MEIIRADSINVIEKNLENTDAFDLYATGENATLTS